METLKLFCLWAISGLGTMACLGALVLVYRAASLMMKPPLPGAYQPKPCPVPDQVPELSSAVVDPEKKPWPTIRCGTCHRLINSDPIRSVIEIDHVDYTFECEHCQQQGVAFVKRQPGPSTDAAAAT